MRSVSEHAFALSEAISELNPSAAANWLRLAAGIYSVGVDLQAYDDSLMMCGSGSKYYDAHSAVASAMVQELTRFFYIWVALESSVESQNRPKSPIIRNLLDAYEAKYKVPVHFQCNALHLETCLIKQSRSFAECETDLPEAIGSKASSVFAFLTKVRNVIVHGGLGEMTAPRWGGRPATELSIIACIQRIALFAIQMLLIQMFADHEMYDRDHGDDPVDVPAVDVLSRIHLEPMQYELF